MAEKACLISSPGVIVNDPNLKFSGKTVAIDSIIDRIEFLRIRLCFVGKNGGLLLCGCGKTVGFLFGKILMP